MSGKNNRKKALIVVFVLVIVSLLSFGIYAGIHEYKSQKFMEKYATGYDKALHGSKTKMLDDETCFSVIKPHLFTWSNNLALRYKESMLIIFTNINNDDYQLGIIINDDEAEKSYQIELDKDWKAKDGYKQEILDANKETVDTMRQMIKDEWGLE